MTDPRETPTNGRVAPADWRGRVAADRFVQPVLHRVCRSVAPLMRAPSGPDFRRERELVWGEGFAVLEERGGWCFGQAVRDGFVGYMRRACLGVARLVPTHRVAARSTCALPVPELKSPDEPLALSMNSLVTVCARHGAFAETDGHADPDRDLGRTPGALYIPVQHLVPIGSPSDPVAEAARLLGVPYLWGGNSGFGVDCSGLVQMALLACGLPCPGDSDQQAARLGRPLGPDEPLRRGDLVFWRGHVAMMMDETRIIHANAHAMAVTEEPLADAAARIASAGEGDITIRRRVLPER